MRNLKDIEARLDEKIPRDVISKRDGGGGRKLDYLEGWYVIDRLNQIFGPLGWSKEIVDVRLLEGPRPSYIVKVKLEISLEKTEDYPFSRFVVKEAYGYGSDKGSNNPHELAIKEAVTDALKVAAKDLGMSMGLALYDKTQENVSDGPSNETQDKAPARSTKSNPKKDNVSSKRELIAQKARVLIAKKTITKEALVTKLVSDFGAKPGETANEIANSIVDSNVDAVIEYLHNLERK